MWKKVAVAKLQLLSYLSICLERLRKISEDISEDWAF
jgi:hypothetical protein